jgi:hypothetical protein
VVVRQDRLGDSRRKDRALQNLPNVAPSEACSACELFYRVHVSGNDSFIPIVGASNCVRKRRDWHPFEARAIVRRNKAKLAPSAKNVSIVCLQRCEGLTVLGQKSCEQLSFVDLD